MNRFLNEVAGVLETEGVTLDTRFRETEGWCSLKAFGLLVMMENDFSSPMDIGEFQKQETVRDLFRAAFISLAARVFGVDRANLSGGSAYETFPEWDSVNHLRLVMEAEKAFGITYPLATIPSLKTLDDFLAAGGL